MNSERWGDHASATGMCHATGWARLLWPSQATAPAPAPPGFEGRKTRQMRGYQDIGEVEIVDCARFWRAGFCSEALKRPTQPKSDENHTWSELGLLPVGPLSVRFPRGGTSLTDVGQAEVMGRALSCSDTTVGPINIGGRRRERNNRMGSDIRLSSYRERQRRQHIMNRCVGQLTGLFPQI